MTDVTRFWANSVQVGPAIILSLAHLAWDQSTLRFPRIGHHLTHLLSRRLPRAYHVFHPFKLHNCYTDVSSFGTSPDFNISDLILKYDFGHRSVDGVTLTPCIASSVIVTCLATKLGARYFFFTKYLEFSRQVGGKSTSAGLTWARHFLPNGLLSGHRGGDVWGSVCVNLVDINTLGATVLHKSR